jgi:RNA polymerase sigma-70 factor (ECF subfamily)
MADAPEPDTGDPACTPGVNSSFQLLERAREGDPQALDLLVARHLPALRRWASGRLPKWARDLSDTDDLVQETLVRSIRRIEDFKYEREGALQAYLRQAIVNRIRDEFRRAGRRPPPVELDDRHADDGASPLEQTIGRETVEQYEAALQRLKPDEREAIIARVELGYSYEEVAQALGRPTSEAARVAVSRALVKLAKEMGRRG